MEGKFPLIYISKDELDHVEYLISQSIKGNHLLFDIHAIRKAYNQKESEPNEKQKIRIARHIVKMIVLPSIARKRAYLERLDEKTYDMVVRTYFSIVENNMLEMRREIH